jgi:hypothetical protein
MSLAHFFHPPTDWAISCAFILPAIHSLNISKNFPRLFASEVFFIIFPA